MAISFTRAAASEAETALIGRALGGLVRAGDVVLLDGALGAGKTTLVRAMAAGMGLQAGAVASPTFVVVHEYGRAGGGLGLVHVDAYRLRGAGDLDSLGWDRLGLKEGGQDEAVGGSVMVVEWAERLGDVFGDAARVRVEHISETARELAFTVPDEWATRAGFDALRARGPTVCPVTGRAVAPDCPTYPFADERARMADLYRWFSGSYTVSRPVSERDLDQSE